MGQMKGIYPIRGTRSYRQLIGGVIGILFLIAFMLYIGVDSEGYMEDSHTAEENNLPYRAQVTEETSQEVQEFGTAPATFNVSGVTIEGNISTNAADEEESTGGGGIFVGIGAQLNLSEDTVIKENIAMNGGGIYVSDTSYQDISVGPDVTFSGNYAQAGWWIYDGLNPPQNTIAQIETRSMSTIADLPTTFPINLSHPLNNNDINYRTEYTITITYKERSGDNLVPLQLADNNGNLQTKPNVYYQLARPVISHELADEIIHPGNDHNHRLVGWMDGEGAEVAYRAGDSATRPALHYIHTNRTLTLIYEEIFIITEEHYKIGQGLVGSPTQFHVRGGEAYHGLPRNFSGYTYVGYRLDGGLLRAISPEIVNIRANHTVRMIYIAQPSSPGDGGSGGSNISGGGGGSSGSGGGSGGPGASNRPGNSGGSGNPGSSDGSGGSGNVENSGQPTEYGNYEFAKDPHVRRVSPGDIVGYTFSDFGNRWGVPLEDFTILDRPDRGIDIIAGSLPAFRGGDDVSYSIHYYTRRGGERRHTIAQNIPANRPFNFQVPRPGDGDYITLLAIEFGSVPADFAVGDTFQLDFRVWDEPPARRLSNIGVLSFRVDGRYREYVTCRIAGMLYIGGWFTSPLTGDVALLLWYILIGLSLIIQVGLLSRRKN